MNRFSFLSSDIFLDNGIGNRSRTHCKVSPRPQMPTPKLLSQMSKLLKEYSRTATFEPLNNHANVLVESIRNKKMNMVACHFPRNNLQFVLHRNLPKNIAHTHSYWPH